MPSNDSEVIVKAESNDSEIIDKAESINEVDDSDSSDDGFMFAQEVDESDKGKHFIFSCNTAEAQFKHSCNAAQVQLEYSSNTT